MNVLFILMKDHHRLVDLFRRYRHLAAGAREERRLVIETLADELRVHARAEQDVFYPALAEGPIRVDLSEAREQHSAIGALLEELRGLEVGDPAWESKVTSLGEQLDRHVRSHHAELFPEARRRLSGERLVELGRRLESHGKEGEQDLEAGASALIEAAAGVARALSRAVGSVLADVPRARHLPGRSRRPDPKSRGRRAPGRSGRAGRRSRSR